MCSHVMHMTKDLIQYCHKVFSSVAGENVNFMLSLEETFPVYFPTNKCLHLNREGGES